MNEKPFQFSCLETTDALDMQPVNSNYCADIVWTSLHHTHWGWGGPDAYFGRTGVRSGSAMVPSSKSCQW